MKCKMNIKKRKFLVNFAFVVASLLACKNSYSQVPTTSLEAIEFGIHEQEDRAKEFQKKIEPQVDILKPQEIKPVPLELPKEDQCYKINKINFIDNQNDLFFWFESYVKPYLSTCIGVEGIQQIVNVLNNSLIEKGYITSRVAVPEQNLTDGVLDFKVMIGKIAAIRMVEQGDLTRSEDTNWGIWQNAFPIKSGDVLNIRDIEQGVEQMKRLPSQKVTTKIEPGENPNFSIVIIEREKIKFTSRIRFGTTVDNSGSKSLGRTQLSSFLAFDNLLGISDLLSASSMSNVENLTQYNMSQSLTLSYSIPFYYHLFSVSNSYNRFGQTLKLTTANELSRGNSNKTDYRWDYTPFRSASAKIGIYSLLSIRRAESFISDREIITQRRKTTNIEVGASVKKMYSRSNFTTQVAYREGTGWFGAESDFQKTESNQMTIRPKIFTAQFNFNYLFTPWEKKIQFSSNHRLQYTKDKTTATDQFSIGGRNTVRGFDGDVILLSENGYLVRNDFTMPLGFLSHLGNYNTYLALDYGYVWGPNSNELVGRNLGGTALGLQGQFSIFQFDIALATPILKPKDFKSNTWNLYLSLSGNI
ncbi:MAG: ShlB/FhaC/HecB family hemolysin secretion/activation protein [Spirobacillus cienkowskii]|jgi:hemolysin activation/secretion protein|uniref:ShlB/FhaC/HecB family hemolysin secretion/activation protein n=1 Tax=Spirobacillus cienkowskii TaxID=495820 RepID=A0A369KRS0_9BACT|nr:MAG: ShlB/FhaC/HecB family hemolysin secretion/activation protein [Spirobacillus cienkowskii]